jgi:ribosome biogenesis GTPase
VGDWVTLDDERAERPRIAQVLPRTTTLERSAVLDRSERQLIATNLDTVFVVCAFATTAKLQNRAMNPRRIERYVALVTSSRATPVVILNKADLVEDWSATARQLSARLGNTLVCPVSAASGSGIPELEPYLAPGQTVAFVGLSGVGKSTLINRLLGVHAQNTGDVRDVDSKGKHTTTRRQMLAMVSGALLVDTPGMRELGVTESVDDRAFEEIAALAAGCRFGDCKHEAEPGCAVQAAIRSGKLDTERLQNLRSLSRESSRFAARYDAYSRHQQPTKSRKLVKVNKSAQKKR